jgi:TraX protein
MIVPSVGFENQSMTTNLMCQLPIVGPRAQQFLKMLALTLMLADHLHYGFFNRKLEWLYWLSRLVFPIFALIVAQNLEHHRADPRRYILRLVIYGIIAQPFYFVCFHVAQLNVMFTLASSIAVWWLLEVSRVRKVHGFVRYGLAVVIAACLPFLEFSWAGVLAVPVFAALMRRGAWWDWLSSFVLAFGIVGFGAPWVMPLLALGLWMLTSRLPERSSRKPSRWSQHMAYGFYPLHLAVIAFVVTMKT